jgi:hypothetical protein
MKYINKTVSAAVWAIAAMVVLGATIVPEAAAQVYHMYPGAPPVKKDAPALGITIGFGDELFRTLGYGRFNVNSVSDIGIELVMDKQNEDWRGGVGADYKYAIVPSETTMPFDLSANAGFGFITGNDITNIDIPIGGMISRPLELSSGGVLVPYGGVYVLIDYRSWSTGVGDDSDWTVDVELRGGAGYNFSNTVRGYANLHFGAGTRFYVGIRFVL